ncbi:MAG: hypothetical protein N2747_07170 [Chitinophagaceae bacterium]|nr:hypothetical protein [Chitinophagaceae bacterium]
MTNKFFFITFYLLFLCADFRSFGQLGFSFNIKKPAEYEERVLRSEKSDKGKFGLPKRFIQNTATHFNYFYNANLKLNEVLQRAKEMHKDDYSTLLSFYNYSLEHTASDSVQLDSIIYKTSAGIALHDLRNDWIDNLYLLWGISYYLQKKFDSAYLMFQFINYAFAPKEKGGYYLTIGSRIDGNSAMSISTKEKKSLHKKIFSVPPSRNDALLWQIRNFLAQDLMAEAASLIVTLRSDPAFPKRLHNDLHEVQALWFYKLNSWDSAAHHLVKALSNAPTLQEKARWEYLAAQLFEMSGDYKSATSYYNKVISHTTDLIMEIYARFGSIRTNKDGGPKNIDKNVDELLRMAKKEKYEEYRDIIYYMAAKMLLDAGRTDEAVQVLAKSAGSGGNDVSVKNKAFLQLAEIAYTQKKYPEAYNYYDSVNLNDASLKDPESIRIRKKALKAVVDQLAVIQRQDSLLRIAALPEEQRKEFVKQLVKQLRKLQGLQDEQKAQPPPSASSVASLFPQTTPRGEWYFYNATAKARGYNEFKTKWGNRPNVDNWRRSAALSSIYNSTPLMTGGSGQKPDSKTGSDEITFDALYEKLPLTDEQKTVALDSLKKALFTLGKTYIQELEDCSLGTEKLNELKTRFPDFQPMDELIFQLYYCYQKTGEKDRAEDLKKFLKEKYPTSSFTAIALTGKDPRISEKQEATKIYEKIYDLFIEGKFQEALNLKKTADEKYGKHYWTPQLLYIQSVYHIRQRQDITAMESLNEIISQFSGTPMAKKAETLIDVLRRRKEIEEELKNLNVTRMTDTTASVSVFVPPYRKTDSSAYRTVPPVPQPQVSGKNSDSTVTKPKTTSSSGYAHNPNEAHYVVMILHKVDPVFVNEAKNAFNQYNRNAFYSKNYSADIFQLDNENRLILIAPFANADDAIRYMETTRSKIQTEIMPWLKGGKYSFVILTDMNFNLLKEKRNIDEYKNFLNQYWPGKF